MIPYDFNRIVPEASTTVPGRPVTLFLMLGLSFCLQMSCQWPEHAGAEASFGKSDRFLQSIQSFEGESEDSKKGLAHA